MTDFEHQRTKTMRLNRRFRPVIEAMGVIALCSGIGTMIAVGPLPELNGTPPGGFLEDPGRAGVEPVDTSAGVDLGLAGITPDAGDVTPNPVNAVEDYDALYDAIHPTDPTPVGAAGAFD
jgi:hypothetical protein